MLNKGKKILKKYPVFIGIFGIMFLMVGLAAYWYHDRMREIVPTVETEDLKREENIERLEKPEQAIKYLIGAIKNQDVDQAMRVFPIDELCLGTNSDKIVEERKEFYSGMLEAPAKEDAAYLPLASSEYTAKYLSVYEKILKSIPGIQEAEIKKIEYMKPEQQLSSEYQIEIEEKCEIYEANAFCDMEVFIEAGMQRYRIPITLVNYDGYWKIFAINGDGNVNDKEVFLFTGEISDVPNADSEKLEKKLQRKIENKEKKEKSEEKKREKNTDILLDEGNGMLPANYVIVNRTFAQNPEMVMKTFIRYTQKKI